MWEPPTTQESSDLVDASVARPQMTGALMGLFAALAERSDVLELVVKQGMVLASIGLVLGMIGALATGRFLEGLLSSISPRDPMVLGGSMAFLGGVAFEACLLPALKATRIHPREALTVD